MWFVLHALESNNIKYNISRIDICRHDGQLPIYEEALITHKVTFNNKVKFNKK